MSSTFNPFKNPLTDALTHAVGGFVNNDPVIVQSIMAGIETLVNQALKYDPASRQAVAAITDVLAVEANAPNFTLYLRGQEDGIAIAAHNEAPVAARLTGSVWGLFQLLKGLESLANTDVHLTGSTSLLQQWQQVLNNLDIDWEDAISEVLGDILGPMAADVVRSSAQWSKQQADEQQRLAKEYLPEELNVTPSQTQADQLYDAIADIAMDTDRLAARLKKLQQAINAADKNESSES